MPTLEIRPRPARAELKLPGLEGACLAVDAGAGKLTWTADKEADRRRGQRTAPLSEVAAVVRATFVMGDVSFGGQQLQRLLFVATDGRCLWTSRLYLPGALDEVWPREELARLRTVGIDVRDETFGTARAMQVAHPGSAPRSQWASPTLVMVPSLVLTLIIVGVVLLVLAL